MDRVAKIAERMVREIVSVARGMCFSWANKWNTQNYDEGQKVVHGLVTNIEGKTFPHAWIEHKGKAYDVNIPNGYPINKFYKLLNPQKVKKYESQEAMRTFIKKKHHGPWHNI